MCMVQCRFRLQKTHSFGGVFCSGPSSSWGQLRYFCLKLQEIHVIHLGHGISTDDGAFHQFPWPKSSICLILPGCKRLKFLLQLVGKKTWANRIQTGWHLIGTKAMKKHLFSIVQKYIALYKVYLNKQYAKIFSFTPNHVQQSIFSWYNTDFGLICVGMVIPPLIGILIMGI